MAASLPIRLALLCATFALAAGPRAGASTLVVPADSNLIARSELVVIGRVVATGAVEQGSKIWTEASVAVEERIKGNSADIVTVREPGGTLADRMSVVFGSAELTAGERVLLFLAERPGGAYRTVDLAAGKFSERTDRAGSRFWFRDLRRSGLRVLTASSAPSSPALQREADSFERALRGGTPDERSYLAPFADEGEIEADFALPPNPGVQRWFAFDEGKSAGWVAMGRQSGYSGGGHPELAAAVSAWTSCPGTRIHYFFAGESTAVPAGTRLANGVNEVFFNDPLNEIPGSWNGRDGVVAVGGFDAVRASGRWTPPAPGSSAPRDSYDSWVILEGDVAVQDGVGPTRGISNATLAEILAHELGHTLGFAHSSDPRALMYASLQDLGPYLREDDRAAAQWLYPGPASPAAASLEAPSNLQVAGVTSDNVRLAWTDNASGEAFQTIYSRPAGGAFVKLRDVGADVTIANVTGLAAEKTHEFQITARRYAEESPPSNVATAAIPRVTLESSFTVAPPVGTAGITTFSFYDQSRGTIIAREWSFGDGGTSSEANPTRVFASHGAWEVTLRVRDDHGEEAVSKRLVSVAAPPPLVADFSWDSAAAIAGTPLRFADRTLGAPTGWSWTFGDGTSSFDRDPVKTFDAPGRYAISLHVESGLQSDSVSRSLEVTPAQTGPPSAAFDFAPAVPMAGQAVAFRKKIPGSAESWLWNFGDGSSSAEPSPTHAYEEPGTYLVTLAVSRGGTSALSSRLLLVDEEKATGPKDRAGPGAPPVK